MKSNWVASARKQLVFRSMFASKIRSRSHFRKESTSSSELHTSNIKKGGAADRNGLFMMERVKFPGDFEREAEEVSSRIGSLRKFILSSSTLSLSSSSSSIAMRKVLLLYLDAISNELCKVRFDANYRLFTASIQHYQHTCTKTLVYRLQRSGHFSMEIVD